MKVFVKLAYVSPDEVRSAIAAPDPAMLCEIVQFHRNKLEESTEIVGPGVEQFVMSEFERWTVERSSTKGESYNSVWVSVSCNLVMERVEFDTSNADGACAIDTSDRIILETDWIPKAIPWISFTTMFEAMIFWLSKYCIES